MVFGMLDLVFVPCIELSQEGRVKKYVRYIEQDEEVFCGTFDGCATRVCFQRQKTTAAGPDRFLSEMGSSSLPTGRTAQCVRASGPQDS